MGRDRPITPEEKAALIKKMEEEFGEVVKTVIEEKRRAPLSSDERRAELEAMTDPELTREYLGDGWRYYTINDILETEREDGTIIYYPAYVNAYAVWQRYGGPEEGGWNYDEGEWMTTVRVENRAEAERVISDLWVAFGPSYGYSETGVPNPGRRGKGSTGGGADIEIRVEETTGKNYPERKPTYE